MCLITDWLKALFGGNGGSEMSDVVVVAATIRDIWKQHNIVWACDPQFDLEDYWFHAPASILTWQYWATEARAQCPSYTENSETQAGFDCDDFADFLPAWCKAKHRVNAVWEVWGICTGYGHAWNIVMCEDGMYEIEPQTGEAWKLGENPDYKAIIAK
jgi:hypothetical protein